MEKDKNNYKALFRLGEAYYKLNDKENAIKYFEKVLELNPNDIEALESISRVASLEIPAMVKGLFSKEITQKSIIEKEDIEKEILAFL